MTEWPSTTERTSSILSLLRDGIPRTVYEISDFRSESKREVSRVLLALSKQKRVRMIPTFSDMRVIRYAYIASGDIEREGLIPQVFGPDERLNFCEAA